MRAQGFDLVVVETAGIGQGDSAIVDLVDVSLYVMTAEYGAASQLEKIDMLDLAGILVLNKFDKRGSQDALRDVRKQWRRNHLAFTASDDEVPVFPTTASQFDDPGVTLLFAALCRVALRAAAGPAGPVRAGDARRSTVPLPARGGADPARADGVPRARSRSRAARSVTASGARRRSPTRRTIATRRSRRSATPRCRSRSSRYPADALEAGEHAAFRAAYNRALAELGSEAVEELRDSAGPDRGDHVARPTPTTCAAVRSPATTTATP